MVRIQEFAGTRQSVDQGIIAGHTMIFECRTFPGKLSILYRPVRPSVEG